MIVRQITLLLIIVLLSASKNAVRKTVTIKNDLNFSRKEVVAIPLKALSTLKATSETWIVLDGKDTLMSQIIDSDSDGVNDQLIFYVNVKAKEEKKFFITSTNTRSQLKSTISTHSRIVPERIDDFAWENDLVAFRTYGPEAQRLVDEGQKGGTLSSGIDCWLKRVDYPVIDKWYRKYVEGGSYHKDDGEGYDPYHVGKGRGCGGIGIFMNDSLYVSKNFVSFKKIAEGPVRNIFELTYAPWTVNGVIINETKRITIDLGNQLCKVEVKLKHSAAIPNCTIGISLHNKTGKVLADSTQGIFGYWETIDDSELGTGVVIAPKAIQSFQDYRTSKTDLSHLYIHARPVETVTYYTGFTWKKAGNITTPESWMKYLEQFSERIQSPLTVKMK